MSTFSLNLDFILGIGIPLEHLYLSASVKKLECEHYQYLFLSLGLGRLTHHKEQPPNLRLLDASPTFGYGFISCFFSGDPSGPFTFLQQNFYIFNYDFVAKKLISQPKHMSCKLGTLKNHINEMVLLRTKAYTLMGYSKIFTILRA